MAVYPHAVNMLIPRGTIGGAGQQPIIRPTIIILHTNASNTSLAGAASLMKNTTKGQEYHFQQEAAGTGRVAGRLGQYVDTTIRADNNYKANSFRVAGVLCGAISIETADHGSPYEKSWTDLGQRRNLEDLVVWLCQTHGIPPHRCETPYSPGIGYHSMWGYNTTTNPNVNPWTNAVGKICPGPGKIREFDDLLDAVARRVEGSGGGEEVPEPPTVPVPLPAKEEPPVTVICATAGAHYLCTFGAMGVIIVPISSQADSTALQKEFTFCGQLSEGQWKLLRSREYIPQQLHQTPPPT